MPSHSRLAPSRSAGVAATGITASIISHGHGPLVLALLAQLAALAERGEGAAPARVLLTLNQPEPRLQAALAQRRWPFELVLIPNASPAGFGSNHNRAFERDRALGGGSAFAVLNPDVRWSGNPFTPLWEALQSDRRVACAYPVQLDAAGALQDSERRLPTPWRLLRRIGCGRRHEVGSAHAPDWVNAAFMLLRPQAFAQLRGFDESYHMYCEDVDLCLRLQLAGWRLARAGEAVVEHAAERASHRDARHLVWHLRSLLRLWRSEVWRAYRRQMPKRAGARPQPSDRADN